MQRSEAGSVSEEGVGLVVEEELDHCELFPGQCQLQGKDGERWDGERGVGWRERGWVRRPGK